MATFDETNAKLDAATAAVQELAREVGILVAAGPGVVTQAQLDSLAEKLDALTNIATAADPNPGGGM